jgi:CheY-like chemotaxis protein
MARVLIVDDDPGVLEFMRTVLVKYKDRVYKSDWKLTVHTLDSAVTALEVIKENNYELIITDILMARMDGWEFIQKIREKFPQFDVPIVVVSAVRGIDLQYECMRHGASAWFTKPIKPKAFAESIFKLIQER